MIKIRKSGEIYHKSGGWFDARWHFSFDDYYDPNNMGFGTMRALTMTGLSQARSGRCIRTGTSKA